MTVPEAVVGRAATNQPNPPESADSSGQNESGRLSGPGVAYGLIRTSAYGASKSRMGGASELRAAVHLMQQGFDVYRCVADHGPFDLVAYRDERLYRVEVKSLSRQRLEHHLPVIRWPVNDTWDILMFCGDSAIFQFPAGVSRDEVKRTIIEGLGIPILDKPEPLIRRVESLLREQPTTEWTAMSVNAALGNSGEPTATIKALLARLADEGIAVRTQRGVYRLADGDHIAPARAAVRALREEQ